MKQCANSGCENNMPKIQTQVASDYLAAYKAANGQEAHFECRDSGLVVVASDGMSTGFSYCEADLVRRLRERAATTATH